MIETTLKLIGLWTCLVLLYQFASFLIGKRIEKYMLDRGWCKFKIDTEYNHNQLKSRVEKLEKK
jgi:hypothetical protein